MRILHLSTTDRSGGAGIAAFRLSEAMIGAGIDSKMLVLEKKSDSGMVVPVKDHKFKHYDILIKIKQFLAVHISNTLIQPKLNYSMGMSHVRNIISFPEIQEADVIYIHWTLSSFINIRDIARIINTGKPVFFFLHDMWPITGGCHYSMGCEGYKHSCKSCPMITRRFTKCISHRIQNKKMKLWNRDNIRVIAPSRWMYECAKNSAIFHNKEFFCIPNTLNDRVFRVLDKKLAREMFGLPLDRRLILFGAIGGTLNPYKGWEYADGLMKRIGEEANMVVFGSSYKSTGYITHAIGRVYDECALALLYNAVDVFILPTQAENLSQTIVESISCGTKVVVFNVGGCSDIVIHKDNGYLASPNNLDDLESGVRWVMGTNNDDAERMRLHDDICKKFSYPVVVKQHLKVIEDFMSLQESKL